MAKLILRQEAINDLSNIWLYTLEKWSEEQADKYYNLLKSTCNEVANNPLIGKEYEEISKSLLGYRVKKHIIFYHAVSQDEIEVIRILHGRMDLKSRIIE